MLPDPHFQVAGESHIKNPAAVRNKVHIEDLFSIHPPTSQTITPTLILKLANLPLKPERSSNKSGHFNRTAA
jgi:hypothetical protein